MKKIKPVPGNLPLFAPQSEWKTPNLSDLPDWSRAKTIGYDSEFSDPTLRKLGIGARRAAKLCGYSFCLDGDKPYYVPLRHPEGNVNCEQGLNYVRDNMRKFKGTLVGANINVDLDIGHYENIRPNFDEVICKDVQVRGALIWEFHFKYSLEAEAERWGYQGKDEAKLKEAAQSYGYDVKAADWKKCIPFLPAKFVGPYGENDAGILIPVYYAQQKVIDAQGLNEVDQLEARLLPLLLKMRQRGVRIDFDHLDRVEAWALAEETRLVAEIKALTGHDIGVGNCMAVERVAPALRSQGIQIPLTDAGNLSIKSEFLQESGPVGKLIDQTRKMFKLRTTFVASVRRYQTNGRIHSTFRQIVGVSEKNEKSGAAYGRLSSCHLNIQQQPSRSKFANFWRKIYLPEENSKWLSCDYSAVEPRWVCHFSSLLKLPGGEDLRHMYCTNPRIDPHQAMADLTGLPRKEAKTVGLGLNYRMGGLKLAKQSLKLPTRWMVQVGYDRKFYFDSRKEALDFRMQQDGNEKLKMLEVAGEEAQAILDRFHNGAPFIRLLAEKCEDKAKATGILKLLGGRHLHFPMDKYGNYDHTYKAVSKVVQGTAAYQMKMALLALDRDCPEFFLQTQIHDEVCGSIPDLATAKKVSDIMNSVVKARVPFRCDAEVGDDWGNLSLLCMEKGCTEFVDPEDKFYCTAHSVSRVAA